MGINLKKLNWKKVLIYGVAIIYLILPADIIIDALPIIGTIDDLLAFFIAYHYAEKKK